MSSIKRASSKVPQPPSVAAPLLNRTVGAEGKGKLAALVQLLNDPASAHQYDQQVVEVGILLRQFPNGFSVGAALEGIPQVILFFTECLLSDPNAHVQALVPALCDLLEQCAIPLVCTTLDDQRRQPEALASLLEAVAGALFVSSGNIRASACMALRQIVAFVRQVCYDDLNPPPPAPVHKLLRLQTVCFTSRVIQPLLATWKVIIQQAPSADLKPMRTPVAVANEEDDPPTYSMDIHSATSISAAENTILLKCVLELSHYAEVCNLMRDFAACELLVDNLRIIPGGDRRVAICIEILWNFLAFDPQACAAELCSVESIQRLFEVFVSTLSFGYKLKERELRNDIIVILSLISQCDTSHALLGPFTELLLELSCGNERGGVGSTFIQPKFHYSTHAQELQLKVLAWNFICQLTLVSADLGHLALTWGFVDVLLCYVDVHCELPAVVQWSTVQLLSLQEASLRVLGTLALLGHEYFVRTSGPRTLREYIDECPDRPLRDAAVTVIARLATTNARVEVISSGGISLALNLLAESGSNDHLLVECLCMVADLVGHRLEHQHSFLGNDGVRTIVPFLAYNPKIHSETRSAVVFSAVRAVWSCIVGSEPGEQQLIRYNGIDALIEIVEQMSIETGKFTLSVLSDLLRTPNACHEFRDWRSRKTGNSACQMMISLWNSIHCSPLGFNNVSLGSIELQERDEDTRTPPSSRQESEDPPVVVAPLVENHALKLKLYSCMSRVGFVGHKELSPLDQSVLLSMEHFETHLQDGMWTAVQDALLNAQVEPISADAKKLKKMQDTAQERNSALSADTSMLKEQQKSIEAQSEATFYRTLIKKTEETFPPDHHRGGAGLSITQAKIRKAQMLKQSFQEALSRQQKWHSPSDDLPGEQQRKTALAAKSSPEALATVAPAVTHVAVTRWGVGQRSMTDEEFSILQMINKVRTEPATLIPFLKHKLSFLNAEGNSFFVPGKGTENCVEGPAPYHEAIEMLENLTPIVTLLDAPLGMLFASRDHMNDLCRKMEVSHNGSDGCTPLQRLQRYGAVPSKSAQLLSLGQRAPIDVVAQLIVDDGIVSRADRRNLLDPDARVCGVSIGPHCIHDNICVVMLAHEYVDKPSQEQRDTHSKFNVMK